MVVGPPSEPSPRYRFADVVLSPGRRLLLRAGEPVSLPPRYLDLLLLLLAERHRVVEREEIHRRVWGGVAVTDGAFTQAVRTLRRALGDDDPRAPRFLRTAARHGYQFVAAGVVEEDDLAPLEAITGEPDRLPVEAPPPPLSATVKDPGSSSADTAGSVAPAETPQLEPVAGGARARGAAGVLRGLLGGALGAATAGVTAALLLGSLLVRAGGAHWRLLPVLCTLGAAVGAWGGGWVGAGAAAGAVMRWPRTAAVLLGAAGGGLAGAIAHQLVGWTMSELLGHTVNALGGAFEGVVLGGAVTLGIALAAPRGGAGARVGSSGGAAAVLAAALAGAIAAGLLAANGARLSGSSLDAIADALEGAQLMAPLGTYLGEPGGATGHGAGPATRLAVALLEGGFFGAGLAVGLRRADAGPLGERSDRRPSPPP